MPKRPRPMNSDDGRFKTHPFYQAQVRSCADDMVPPESTPVVEVNISRDQASLLATAVAASSDGRRHGRSLMAKSDGSGGRPQTYSSLMAEFDGSGPHPQTYSSLMAESDGSGPRPETYTSSWHTSDMMTPPTSTAASMSRSAFPSLMSVVSDDATPPATRSASEPRRSESLCASPGSDPGSPPAARPLSVPPPAAATLIDPTVPTVLMALRGGSVVRRRRRPQRPSVPLGCAFGESPWPPSSPGAVSSSDRRNIDELSRYRPRREPSPDTQAPSFRPAAQSR